MQTPGAAPWRGLAVAVAGAAVAAFAAGSALAASNYPTCPASPVPLGNVVAPSGSTVFDTTTLTSALGAGQEINGLAVWVFDKVDVPVGATIVGVGSRPLVIVSRSSFNVAGTVSVAGGDSTGVVAGAGGAGGGAGGPGGASLAAAGSGPGGGVASEIPGSSSTGSSSGGGGGGFGGAGGSGAQGFTFSPGAGGIAYGDLLATLQGGSGGGSGGDISRGGGCTAAGGGGGGAVMLSAAGTLTITGQVDARGGHGVGALPCAGGTGSGAGSGGGIVLAAGTVDNSGSVTADGGSGGNASAGAGGGGGGGRILVSAGAASGTGTYRAAGGAAGVNIITFVGLAAPGAAGVITQDPTGSLAVCAVRYSFSGFLAPVDAVSVNKVKAGAAVPAKFSLGGNRGLAIFEAGYPYSHQAACEGGPAVDVTATVSAGGSGLVYDPASDTYTYVWKTEKAWGGQCRQLNIRFTDGTSASASFQFK